MAVPRTPFYSLVNRAWRAFAPANGSLIGAGASVMEGNQWNENGGGSFTTGRPFDSYTLFLPGNALTIGDMALVVARHVSDSFALGLQLASPLVVTGFTYYLGLGLLNRLMPQMPVFFVGMPIQIVIQLSVLLLTVSGMMLVFLSRFGDGVGAFLAP